MNTSIKHNTTIIPEPPVLFHVSCLPLAEEQHINAGGSFSLRPPYFEAVFSRLCSEVSYE